MIPQLRILLGIVLPLAVALAACTDPAGQGTLALATTPAGEAAITAVPAAQESQAEQAVASPTGTASSPASLIPLEDALDSLQPYDVFQNFYDITQVPRPSGHIDKIRDFLVEFGQGLGLETIVDEAGNVIIRKPAAAGFENRQVVVLQAHMDMVPQKTEEKVFDFTTDPIQAFVSGDYIVTDGTTLGADDGIGMAMIMAVLQSETLPIGPIEALFTVDEETDLTGATGLEPDTLTGTTLINLDWETEGTFTIGSAGGVHAAMSAAYPQEPAPTDMISYSVEVQGLQGGHSGVDINTGRGHATKLLVRLLAGAVEPFGLRLASLTGGTAVNAIPREASAVVLLSDDRVDAFTAYIREFEATIRSELAAVEPDLGVALEAVAPPTQVMDETFQRILIDALYATPQGVLRMSDAVPGLVETSTNLGIVTVQDGQMEIIMFPRSSVDSGLEDVAQMIASVWDLAGYPAELSDYFAAWTPDADSPISNLMKTTHFDLFGQEPAIAAVHAGLECGEIGATYPEMDMISIGPTIEHGHSPAEDLYIPSVEKAMALLMEVLQRMPEESSQTVAGPVVSHN